MGGKRASGKHYTSVGKYPVLGKKTLKAMRKNKETSFRSFIARADYENNKISEANAKKSGKADKSVMKIKLERYMTKTAKAFYDAHDGNICWGRIVLAMRTGEKLDNFRATKKSRGERPNFDIRIKLSEVQKYSEMYGTLV